MTVTTSRSKKTLHAAEQDRPDVAAARAELKAEQLSLRGKRLIFIDETSVTTKMVRHSGRAPRGERLVASVPHGHWKTLTFIAGLRINGLTAPYVIDGAMDGPTFMAYVEQVLAPTLAKGDVVFADNLRTPQDRRGTPSNRRCRCNTPLSACIFARPQSHRDGVLETQSCAAQRRQAHREGTLAADWKTRKIVYT